MSITISVGHDRNNAKCEQKTVETAQDLADYLNSLEGKERWWVPHLFKPSKGKDGNKPEGYYRGLDFWDAMYVFAIDIDFHGPDGKSKGTPDEKSKAAMEGIAGSVLQCQVFHHTPHGCRVIWIFKDPVRDKPTAEKLTEVFCIHCQSQELPQGYAVDTGAANLAQFMWAPHAAVYDKEKKVHVVRSDDAIAYPNNPPLATTAWLSRYEMQDEPIRIIPMGEVGERTTMSDAINRFNAEHPEDYGKPGSGKCPICLHDDCFGRLIGKPGRWCCWSTNHPDGAGHGHKRFHWGDALDIASYQAGKTPIEFLRQVTPHLELIQGGGAAPKLLVLPEAGIAAGPSVGYAYKLLSDPAERLKLRMPIGEIEECIFDGAIFIDRRIEITDNMLTRIRVDAEKLYYPTGGGDRKPLKFKRDDLLAAVRLVGSEHVFNPVAEWLNGLEWDRFPRIDYICKDMFDLSSTGIPAKMVTKWLIAAVARALSPGCKADNVLILIGQVGGEGKSTFFSTLAGTDRYFFSDQHIDVANKDSWMVLGRAWIHEWGELSTIHGRELTRVLSFVSKVDDEYRKPYGQIIERHIRRCIFCGTGNRKEFIELAGGKRRWWPIETAKRIDLAYVRDEREQIWAEAVARYRAGEKWFLDTPDEDALTQQQEDFEEVQPWMEPIRKFLNDRPSDKPFKIDDVFEQALQMPDRSKWNVPANGRVIGGILDKLGYKKVNRRITLLAGKEQTTVWVKK